MEFRYNCLSSQFKRPFGCIKEHESGFMAVEVSLDVPVSRLEVVIESDRGVELQVPFQKETVLNDAVRYSVAFTLPRCDLFFYHFVLHHKGTILHLYRDGENGVSVEHGQRWQLTCYPAAFDTPQAFAGAVMYQIFPDRFFQGAPCDAAGKLEPYWLHEQWGETPNFRPDSRGEVLNNDFFGGNLDGVRQKLEYLQSLHVQVIYLNPICMAFSNHRYDTADYKRVDPLLGTAEDFSALCRDAHNRGMKVILDGVFSHTGSNSVYFDREGVFGNGAYRNPDSPYHSWYDFQEYPDKYTCWWNFKTLPCVKEMDPRYLDFVVRAQDSVISYWLGLGADGFRLDVADELPDEFIALFRARVKELNPEAIVLGEVWEDASNKISYGIRRRYFSAGELDSVMNYPFRDAILAFLSGGDSAQFRKTVLEIAEHYPAPVLHCLMNSLSTHDTARILTLLGDPFQGSKEEKEHRFLSPEQRTLAVAREMAAAVLQFTLPGAPSIYYGDEVGLEGYEDPLNRRCFPWGKEDGTLLDFYRLLTGLKTTYTALKQGEIRFLPSPVGVIDFVREFNGQRIRTIVNGGTITTEPPLNGEVLFLHYGRKAKHYLSLDQWGCAIILEHQPE